MSKNDLRLVVLEGTIVRDARLETSKNGLTYLPFTIASNQSYKTDEGYKEKTDFFNLSLFGMYAQKCATLLKKGMEVRVEGELGTVKDAKSNYTYCMVYVKKVTVTRFPRKKEEENQNQSQGDTEETVMEFSDEELLDTLPYDEQEIQDRFSSIQELFTTQEGGTHGNQDIY